MHCLSRIRSGLPLLVTLAVALPWGAAEAAEWGWLPPNINSAYGDEVDDLYLVIMYLVLVMFALTEGALLVSCLLFRRREGHRARYSHGNLRAELFWSVVPAIILVWLALVQTDTWAKVRERFPTGPEVYRVQALAEQFSWNFRYPGTDGQFGTADDAYDGTLVVPVRTPVVITLASKDVIHSLFLPHLRVKQDTVPGLRIKVWFEAGRVPCWDLTRQELALLDPEDMDAARVAVEGFAFQETRVVDLESREPWDEGKGLWKGLKAFAYAPAGAAARIRHRGATADGAHGEAQYALHSLDVACAELCGLGHFRMKSRLFIWPRDMVDAWMAAKAAQGADRQLAKKWRRIYDEGHPHWNQD
ncbi:MAG: cytochrome c oxidase subunit II [Planctomycetes bacterium]|nr:cytochrome c oxidase subunit II [Planctomycetota bacterium]